MLTARLFLLAFYAWSGCEVTLSLFRRARRASETKDRGTMALLFVLIGVGISAGSALAHLAAFRLPGPPGPRLLLAFALLLSGVAIRWTAIAQLGRFFTVNVAVQEGHHLVAHGLYRRLLHPSYTGLLLALASFGPGVGSWLSGALVLVPVLPALVFRIHVEEQALAEAFGAAWAEHAKGRWRLVPWLY